MGFNVILNNYIPWADLLGLVIGHLYYFLEDVYPRMPGSAGRRILKTPEFIREWFEIRDRADPHLRPNLPLVPAERVGEDEAPLQAIPAEENPIENNENLLQRRPFSNQEPL
jgi:hypothetical protein